LGKSVFVAGCARTNARGGSKETDEETFDRTDRRPALRPSKINGPSKTGRWRLRARAAALFARKLLRCHDFLCAPNPISGVNANYFALAVSHSVRSRHI